VTSAQRRIFSVVAGAGSLVTLIYLDFLGQVKWFEDPSKPAWQALRLWGILSLVIPGVLVGLITRQNRGVCGAIAGTIGCVLVGTAISVALVKRRSLAVDSWLGLIVVVAVICGACTAFARLAGVVLDRWSPNTSLERTRER